MAYTTINKSSLHMNTKLYTGTGSTASITGVGFQPDFSWIKVRNNTDNHVIFDAIRGATKRLEPNITAAEATISNELTAFNSDGFSIGGADRVNRNNDAYASWNWKAGTTGSGNTTGSGTYKAYSYSVNTTAGFSIVKYVGNGSAGHTIPHHLGAVPSMMIIKDISVSSEYKIYHKSMANTEMVVFDGASKWTGRTEWNSTTPTSTVFSLGNQANVNTNDRSYIAYVFTEKTGYSKFDSYIGNGNADGTFVYTGFAPSFVLVKRLDGSHDWRLRDNKRPGYNLINKTLYPNGNWAEGTGDVKDFLSNGFKFRTTGGSDNNSGSTYIYMAFGQSIVGTNNVPCTAR